VPEWHTAYPLSESLLVGGLENVRHLLGIFRNGEAKPRAESLLHREPFTLDVLKQDCLDFEMGFS
jgi:hypothetical protein